MTVNVTCSAVHANNNQSRIEKAYSRTIGRNFGLSTADSCNLVLAAIFSKDSEYFDHCW